VPHCRAPAHYLQQEREVHRAILTYLYEPILALTHVHGQRIGDHPVIRRITFAGEADHHALAPVHGETKYGDGRVTELSVDGVRIVTAWACHLCRLFSMGQNETLRVTAAIATPAGGAPAAPAAAARHNSCSDQGPTTGASGPCTLSRTLRDMLRMLKLATHHHDGCVDDAELDAELACCIVTALVDLAGTFGAETKTTRLANLVKLGLLDMQHNVVAGLSCSQLPADTKGLGGSGWSHEACVNGGRCNHRVIYVTLFRTLFRSLSPPSLSLSSFLERRVTTPHDITLISLFAPPTTFPSLCAIVGSLLHPASRSPLFDSLSTSSSPSLSLSLSDSFSLSHTDTRIMISARKRESED
jgi:hypothetical protein